VISAFRIKWENAKPYVVKMARKMPARHYGYKPTDCQMTFKEQLLHIRENMLWLRHGYMVGDTAYEDTTQPVEVNKEATIKLLGSAFDTVGKIVSKTNKKDLKDSVDFFAGPKSKLQTLNLIQDHVTHHQGRLIVYLNLKGLEPPDYVGW